MPNLNFEMASSDQPSWCWAATAVSARNRFFHDPPPQCEVVAQQLNLPACGDPRGANRTGFLEHALFFVGCFGGTRNGPLDPGDAHAELEAGRPIGCRIEWIDGTGHFVVMDGITDDGSHVWIKDPRTTSSDMDYDVFASNYLGLGGRWAQTYAISGGNTAPEPHGGFPGGGSPSRRMLRAVTRSPRPGEYPVYVLLLDGVASADVGRATRVGYRTLSADAEVAEAIDLYESSIGPARHRGVLIDEMHRAVRILPTEQLSSLRFLEIPSLDVSALWFTGPEGDEVVPIAPASAELLSEPQSAIEFLTRLIPQAEIRQREAAEEHRHYYTQG